MQSHFFLTDSIKYISLFSARLLGVCADEDPVLIVMEFMPGGALLDYLRKKGSHQSKKKLCTMCIDASRVKVIVFASPWVGVACPCFIFFRGWPIWRARTASIVILLLVTVW